MRACAILNELFHKLSKQSSNSLNVDFLQNHISSSVNPRSLAWSVLDFKDVSEYFKCINFENKGLIDPVSLALLVMAKLPPP